jgi:hypothetical protein
MLTAGGHSLTTPGGGLGVQARRNAGSSGRVAHLKTSARHRTASRPGHRAGEPWASAVRSAPWAGPPTPRVEPRSGSTVAAGPRPEGQTPHSKPRSPWVSLGAQGGHGMAQQRHSAPRLPGWPRARASWPADTRKTVEALGGGSTGEEAAEDAVYERRWPPGRSVRRVARRR